MSFLKNFLVESRDRALEKSLLHTLVGLFALEYALFTLFSHAQFKLSGGTTSLMPYSESNLQKTLVIFAIFLIFAIVASVSAYLNYQHYATEPKPHPSIKASDMAFQHPKEWKEVSIKYKLLFALSFLPLAYFPSLKQFIPNSHAIDTIQPTLQLTYILFLYSYIPAFITISLLGKIQISHSKWKGILLLLSPHIITLAISAYTKIPLFPFSD